MAAAGGCGRAAANGREGTKLRLQLFQYGCESARWATPLRQRPTDNCPAHRVHGGSIDKRHLWCWLNIHCWRTSRKILGQIDTNGNVERSTAEHDWKQATKTAEERIRNIDKFSESRQLLQDLLAREVLGC